VEDLKIAAVCMRSEPGRVERNLERMERLVLEASASGARLVCFPELSVTGYVLKRPEAVYRGMGAEDSIGELIRMAREAEVVVLASLVETVHAGKPFITQVVAGPKGLLGRYRKTHLSPLEKEGYQAGQEVRVFSYGSTRFGVQLCYEGHFPELSTAMAMMGAEVIFLPHASPRGRPGEKSRSWERHLPARAFDNSVFVVACNQVGPTRGGYGFPGVALVIAPDGRVISRYLGDGEKCLVADLEGDRLREVRTHRMRYFFPHRRPELYRDLCRHPGPTSKRGG